MNEIMQIALLAVIQGITEFLPVSSSGHLVLAGQLIGFNEQGTMTEVLLHTGTFLAVLVYFRKRIIALSSGIIAREPAAIQYVTALAAGSIPIVLVYFTAGDIIESLFDKPVWSGIFLCITGILLLSLLIRRSTGLDINPKRGGLIGLMQAFALLPGISRSGSTIVAARHLGISPEKAAEFSFLLYLPAMAGAMLIKTLEVLKGSETIAVPRACAGVLISAIAGYAALALLIRIMKKHKLWIFGIYCLAVGVLSILVLMF